MLYKGNMTMTDATKITDTLAATTAELADANDAAVNAIRDYCAQAGYNAAALVAEEGERIRAQDLTLGEYLRVRRTGSTMKLRRSLRREMFILIATRRALRARR